MLSDLPKINLTPLDNEGQYMANLVISVSVSKNINAEGQLQKQATVRVSSNIHNPTDPLVTEASQSVLYDYSAMPAIEIAGKVTRDLGLGQFTEI